MLGIVLVHAALELGRTSLGAGGYRMVVGVGVPGVLTNIGLALVVGVAVDRLLARVGRRHG